MAPRRPSGKALLAGAAALVALAGGGVAAWIAASDDDDPARRTTSVATAPTQRETEAMPGAPPETVPTEDADQDPAQPGEPAQPAPEATETEAPTDGTQKTRFPSDRRIPKRFAIPPAREFSGSGNASLGTVEIRAAAVVKWSSQGNLTLRFGREDFPIVAPSATGQLIVPPYDFELVRVIAKGRWKISITPQN